MKIPTPSFFRIRVIALILAFVVLCLFVGLLKSAFVFAECIKTTVYHAPYTHTGETYYNKHTYGYDYLNGGLQYVSTKNVVAGESYERIYQTWVTWEWKEQYDTLGWWIVDSAGNTSYTYDLSNTHNDINYDMSGIDQYANQSELLQILGEGCEDPCRDEINQAISDCGGEENIDWTNYNEETCSLSCKCQAEINAALLNCLSGYTIDRENCTYDCYDCADYTRDAIELCKDKGGLHSVLCKDGDYSGTVEIKDSESKYTCNDDLQVTETPDYDDRYNPDDPADDPAPDPEDPDSDITNQWLAKIKQNTDTIVNQNNASNNYEANIAENLRRSVDNQSILNDSINNLGEQLSDIGTGIGDEVAEGVREGMQGVEDELDEISSGSYSPGDQPDPYASEEYSFGDRTSEFLDQMKSTGVFSLPNQLSSSIPGGGTSTLIIEGGETYGSHTIDFSDYSPAILILRGIFQIAGMILAIRIVTLKR